MKTILFPTDFSDNAHNALQFAMHFFGADNHFIFLNTWQAPYTPPEVLISVEDVLMKASKDGLEKELKKAKLLPDSQIASFETISEFGILTEVVRHIVKEKKVDYIVMGTQGVSGIKEVLLGSNTASVAKNIDCPLLVVPALASFSGINNIVFAADYKSIEHEQSLVPIRDIAQNFNAEVTVLNILDEGTITNVKQGSEGLKIDHLLTGVKHTFSFIEKNDKSAGINEYLLTNNPDMLVMLKRKNGLFGSIFHRSTTKQMAFHSHIPMLVLHE